MRWNWELPGWPAFKYDFNHIAHLEKEFLKGVKQLPPIPQSYSPIPTLRSTMLQTFDELLTDEIIWDWHFNLFKGQPPHNWGTYRTESVQISYFPCYGFPRVIFKGPPSTRISSEMEAYIKWFNASRKEESILGRAAISYVHFLSIHPFKDGNGRIGRLLVEKNLSQAINRPCPIERALEQHRQKCCLFLKQCNHTMEAQPWVEFFAGLAVDAVTKHPHKA